MPRVSVIMPCYNQGAYIDEAVKSVLAQTYQDFELVVVNDGSTDRATIEKLKAFDRPKTRVLHTENQGVAAARNNGIREARGEYILPLDADDRIGDTYMEKAVRVLDEQEDVGIVYCEAEFFGAESGKWELPEYKFPEFLLQNFIFCSGFFRRSDWEKTPGYRPVYSWEDYDFWLSLVGLGRRVYRIPETLFYYRRAPGSRVTLMTWDRQREAYRRIFDYHEELYAQNARFLFDEIMRLREELAAAGDRLEHATSSMRKSPFWKLREQLLWLKALLPGSGER